LDHTFRFEIDDDDEEDSNDNDDDDNYHLKRAVDDPLYLLRFCNIRHFSCLYSTSPSLLQPYLPLSTSLFGHGTMKNVLSLNLHGNEDLQWHLSDVCSLPTLKDLRCINNFRLQGDIEEHLSSSTLPETMEILDISGCTHVTGRLRHFAQRWTRLQWLGIHRTKVVGDLRVDIQPGDFPSLQGMGLGELVYGAYTLHKVEDAPAIMKARHQIISQSQWDNQVDEREGVDDDGCETDPYTTVSVYPIIVHLSADSAEYYERIEQRLYSSERDPPFSLEMVTAGRRRGWRWSNYLGGHCDTHWLDPPPEPTDKGYATYRREYDQLVKESAKSLFVGYLEPPNPQEYYDLCRRRPP
jgi:hypothetical protein